MLVFVYDLCVCPQVSYSPDGLYVASLLEAWAHPSATYQLRVLDAATLQLVYGDKGSAGTLGRREREGKCVVRCCLQKEERTLERARRKARGEEVEVCAAYVCSALCCASNATVLFVLFVD